MVRGEKARCTDAEHHWELELGHSDCHFQGHFVGTLDSNGLVERCVKFEDAFFGGGPVKPLFYHQINRGVPEFVHIHHS